jgi:hypothetical protein
MVYGIHTNNFTSEIPAVYCLKMLKLIYEIICCDSFDGKEHE